MPVISLRLANICQRNFVDKRRRSADIDEKTLSLDVLNKLIEFVAFDSAISTARSPRQALWKLLSLPVSVSEGFPKIIAARLDEILIRNR